MAFHLKHQSAGKESVPPRAASGWNADRHAAGAGLYADNCQTCHGADGKGSDGVAPALAGNASVTSRGPETVARSVLQGFAPSGRWGVMPSLAETLSAQEVADVVNYVRVAWGGDNLANATPSLVNNIRIDGVTTVAGVSAALVCPSAPTSTLDAETLREVGARAGAGTSDAPRSRLMRRYRARHPDVDGARAVVVLTGAWCRDTMVSAADSTADKQQRDVAFMARLAEASIRPR